jgi:hypothetical protein
MFTEEVASNEISYVNNGSGNISILNIVHAKVNLDFLSRFEGRQT